MPAANFELPNEIDDAERIVRAIKFPYHVNKSGNKLRPSAFRPEHGKSVVSVIRQLMGNDFCKNKAVELFDDAYIGLAVIRAGEIRKTGSQVYNAPEDYVGHAHIDHEFPTPPPHEPQESADNERMTLRCKALVDACLFHRDQRPSVPGWAGPPL